MHSQCPLLLGERGPYTLRTFEPPLDHSLKGVETMVSKHTAVNEGIRY